MTLCLVSWAQTLVYFHKWSAWKAGALAVTTGAVFGGVEAALILTIRVGSASLFSSFFSLSLRLHCPSKAAADANDMCVGVLAAI